MTMQSVLAKSFAATILAWSGLARASFACDDYFTDHAPDGKLSILAFVPVSPSSASPEARRADQQTFQFNLKTKMQSFASGIRRSSGETLSHAMTFEPFVCEATNRITDPKDLVTLMDRNTIGAVWSDPASPNIVNISILLPNYAVAKNLHDLANATISIDYRLPGGDLRAQWNDALDLERPPFSGVYAFGFGIAYLKAQRFVAAKYSLCMSRSLITEYLKNAPNPDSREILQDMVGQLDQFIAEAVTAMTANKLAEPPEVYAMCVAAKPQH